MNPKASSRPDMLDRYGHLVDVLVFVLWAGLVLGMVTYW
jgi:hypothetical protein